jgi:Ser/Thr protein kinase RdoA (MazF antagonist)
LFGHTPSQAFTHLDENNKDSNWGSSEYSHLLDEKGLLTPEVIKKWIEKCQPVKMDAENLKVTSQSTSRWSQQIFFIEDHESQYVLKVYPNENGKQEAQNTYNLSQNKLLNAFNADIDFPKLTLDVWTGSYETQKKEKYFISLMPKAQGISLSQHLIDEKDNEENILKIISIMGKLIGKANENGFFHGDLHFDNIIVQNDENNNLSVTLIDFASSKKRRSNFR